MTQVRRAGISFGGGKKVALVAARRGAPRAAHAGGSLAAELGPALTREDEERQVVPAFPDELQLFASGAHHFRAAAHVRDHYSPAQCGDE